MSANKIYFVLMAITGISTFFLISVFIKTLSLVLAQAVYFCQKVLLATQNHISHIIPLLLLSIILFPFIFGLAVGLSQLVKTRIFIKKKLGNKVRLPEYLKHFTIKLKLQGKVYVVKDKEQFSFCYGLFRPAICISTSLIKSLSREELRSVLIHENYHLKNYDPLKIFLGNIVTSTFFFLPAVKDILEYYSLLAEVAADKAAINGAGKEYLFSAFTKLISASPNPYALAVDFTGKNNLEKRLFYFAGNREKISFQITKKRFLFSILVVAFFLISVNIPVYAVKSVNDKSSNMSYYVCPFGNDCANVCASGIKASMKNNSNNDESLPFTPAVQ